MMHCPTRCRTCRDELWAVPEEREARRLNPPATSQRPDPVYLCC
jgi:hypothetical protein